jgi:hypothetical protein
MCGGGTTQTSTVSIPPEVLANYQKVFGRAEQIAEKPFQAYSKDPNAFVAGLTPTQQASLENINQIQGMASGDVAAGQGMIGAGIGQGNQLQQASLGTAAEGQGVGSQLYGRSLGTSSSGLNDARQIYGQALPTIARASMAGENYAQDAATRLYAGINQAQPYMGEAAGLTRMGLGAGQQYAGMTDQYLGAGTRNVGLGGLDTEKYMSPYLNQVVRATQALQAEENEAQRSALKGQAIRAGAFGGDRAGVAQANLARQQSLANQSTLANILQQGYGQAQSVAGQQQQADLSARQADRTAQQFGAQQTSTLGQQQFGQALSAAQQQAALGQALYSQNIGQGQAIANLGQQQFGQGITTAQTGAGMGKDIYGMSAQDAQLQQAAAQGMFGQAAQVAALQQSAGNNMFNYGLQGGQGVANLGLANQQAQMQAAQAQMQMGQIQQQTDQAGKTALYNQFTQQQGFPYQQTQFLGNLAMGTGALSGSTTTTNTSGGGFFSDRRMKDNAERIGETFDGQPIYRYNYKGDNRTRIGMMAQDVEKDNPKAVGRSQGYKTLDYEKATDKAAKRGRFYSGGLVPASMGGAVGQENAYEGYARGGYAEGGTSGQWSLTGGGSYDSEMGGPNEWTNSATGEIKYGSDPTEREAAAAKAATDVSGIDPRINQFYQESMFRDAEPEGAKYWQQQLDRGASIEDVRSGIGGSRERQLVNQAPLTYDASSFQNYAAPVRNRYGSASAPAGSFGASFQPQPVQQASGKGPAMGQQMGGYQQPMSYGYGPQMGGYNTGFGNFGGFGGFGGYQQPSQMSQFNQGYNQGYMGGYQPMQQASGKGVGPSSYQSNYGYSNPYGMGSSSPQASGKGPSSSGGGASGFRSGGRVGYAGGGHIDPNDLAALASQRMMELAPHAAGMPGQTMPGAQSYVSNKQLHIPKLVVSNVPPPRQQAGGLDTAMAHAEKINKLGSMFSGKGTFGEDSTIGKAGRKVLEGAKGAFSGEASSSAATAPSEDLPVRAAAPVNFDAGPVDGFYVPEFDPDLGYASGGLVPQYAAGGSLPYGGGVGGGGYIPEELLQVQPIQGLPRDNEQLKAAGAKATAGGSGGLGDVMKAANLGYKLAPESLKKSISSMMPGATPATPSAGLGAAAEAAPIAAANSTAPATGGLGAALPGAVESAIIPGAVEATSGLGAAAAPAAEIAGLGAAAAPAAEAAAALPALLGAGEAAALGSAAAGTAATAASAAAPIAAAASAAAPLAMAGAEGIGALLAFLPFFSDRRLKENIKPIGKTYDGQTIYRYNFKGDDRTQVGLIAQEVEKRHKDAVGSAGDMKTVDYKRATEDAADRGHFYNGGVIPFRRGYADGMTVEEADLPAFGARDVSRSSPSDEEYAIRTIAAEMGGKSPEEARGIAAVIENRLKSGRWGEGYKDVVMARNQFEPWNNPQGPNYPMRFADDSPRMQMAREAFGSRNDDPTGGALHFYAPSAQAILAQTKGDRAAVPSWARGRDATDIGPTRFVRNVDGPLRPPRNIPNVQQQARQTPTSFAALEAQNNFAAPQPSAASRSDVAKQNTAADRAIAVAKQPSAVPPANQTPSAPAKKDGDGSFPIRPPATARGKEQDWSDFLTSKQFILPALTAIGTMGTTPTRDFGTALSAGLLGGVKSYQDLDKTFVELEQKKALTSETEQKTKLSAADRLLDINRLRAARNLPMIKSLEDLERRMREGTLYEQTPEDKSGTAPQAGVTGGSPPSGVTTEGTVGRVDPQLEGEVTVRAVNAPAAQKAMSQIDWNNVADSHNIPKLQKDIELFRQMELGEKSAESLFENKKQQAALINTIREITKGDELIDKQGNRFTPPGWQAAANQIAREKIKSVEDAKSIAIEETAQRRLRTDAPSQLARFDRVQGLLEQFQTGPLANIKTLAPALAEAVGMSEDKYNQFREELERDKYERFVKESKALLFKDLETLGGRFLTATVKAGEQAVINPDIQPSANRALVAAGKGLIEYHLAFAKDYRDFKEKNPYPTIDQFDNFEENWKEKNKVKTFVDRVQAKTPVKGDFPVRGRAKDGWEYIMDDPVTKKTFSAPNGVVVQWSDKKGDFIVLRKVQ